MNEPAAEGFRLSPQQKRVWRLQTDLLSNPFYVRGAISIEGSLDLELLRLSLARVTQRYEILRTVFRFIPGLALPVQVPNSAAEVILETVHYQGLPGDENPAARQAMESVSAPTFDLAVGPTLYWRLVTLSAGHHLVIVDASALVADVRSIREITEEVRAGYEAALRGGVEPESDAPLQYADLAQWQNDLLESEEAKPVFSDWQTQDLHVAISSTLPLESGKRDLEFKPQSVPVEWPPDMRRSMGQILDQLNTPAPHFLLAAWSVLIQRLTGVAGVVIGACSEGRNDSELEHALGPIARYVPVCAAVKDELTFPQLLTALGSSFQEAVERQDYFVWERILPSTGDDSRFFPVTFTFEERSPRPSTDGVRFHFSESHGYIDRLKLDLKCVQAGDGIALELRYDANALTEETVRRWAQNLETLLAGIARDPESALSGYDIVPELERDRLTREFNETRTPSGDGRCVHEWIAENAVLKANQPAVVYENQQLTYAALNMRANQLAHHLRGKGVGPDVPVAICCERSVEMIVGVLAILKAGGAYVPLSPAYPKDRLHFMLQDCGAPVLVTTEKLLPQLPPYAGSVVLLDSHRNIIVDESSAQPDGGVKPSNLAYLIYTSGSTGQPKGVEVRHGNLSHSTRARHVYYADPVERFMLLSPIAFDSSVAGVFWTLCAGGTLILPTDGAEQDPAQLAGLFERQKITHTLTLPSLYGRLLAEAKPGQLASLRVAVVAGEACTAEIIERHHRLAPHATLFNEYGPTEGTVWSTVYECADAAVARVPIGKPAPNVRVYILDAQQRPVPIGVAGELYVGGPGVAQGYRNRADLTEQRFVPNPFGNEAADRLYRTGDMARFLPDGNIEFLGRTDHQVKIRGYRIELEEIESVLARHPDVAQAATAAKDHNGENRIVAYIVPRPNRNPTISDLRDSLSRQLPEYMIPSSFVMIDALPLNPNGKVDRNALPEPDHVRPSLRQAFVAPASPIEELLAEIWAGSLDVERVGIHDNFLELGGHSILATRLVSQVRDMLQIDLSLRSVFEHPTVAQLAELILRDSANRSRIEKTAAVALRVVRASEAELKTALREKTVAMTGADAESTAASGSRDRSK